MKKVGLILIIIFSLGLVFLTGCTHEMVSLYIYKMPNKLVYELGEELNLSGLELRNIKTDSALTRISNKNANFSGFDSLTSGKKEVTVSYGKFTTSFNVYVANKVVNNTEELKNVLENLNENDIILLKDGDYNITSPIEINTSNVVIGGRGMDKTHIKSFVILGGSLIDGEIQYDSVVENISLVGIGFDMQSSIENSIVKFSNETYNYTIAAINCENINGLNITSCKFEGFSYGVKANVLENSLITNNTFKKLYVGAIEVNFNIRNSSISKNIINSTSKSVVLTDENDKQEFLFGIKLSFNDETNCGVSIFKNAISKIAIKDMDFVYLNKKTNGNFSGLNYMNNSAAIIIRSSGKNNLQTNGIAIFYNSIGSTLNNILYNTTENDRINSSSVMYMAL